ncbi:Cof-type HAD-IIB family hydrolase [Avibacterium paragallinarum]|uniref:Cof-type HAD-IIB family hydrolase n=1 Tax=Avibacterium paragallinarum TaxID=728 RepID=UPI00021ACF33|nr:Cof-type HAD-IIB family hydrolase [Avibacterium paragallinarum]AZI15068.1 Cof-type HAD-IIB family hydrolase [Avibacterium paragallinarum]QIR12500.1 Cof-type HAD-IIB family hydrolase [Avibacterium paragallinarum]QJE10545.1 Cof-type HAD-IIB family hydrolase [Avibacterium paragallinarum]QJE12738.1 Cof-type HAD-IIB family hydrolase [Avibacterium paragallinarum]QJE14940.1 Cof-type HAD-IIB family hydrolase [Avibacterium paragallinarum]
MQNQPFRAVVSDLDGTLLNGNHVIGDFTIETLEKLAQKKIDIILATGRSHQDVAHILGKVKLDNAVMITSNGARVHNLQGELLLSNSLPEDIALEIMQTPYDEKNVFVNSYQDEGWFISLDLPELAKYHQDSGFSYQVVDFQHHHGRGTEKVFFIGRTAADLAPIEQHLKQRFGDAIYLTYSTPQCLEIMNKNVSKATALVQVIAPREYGLTACIAFGDGMNDVEMLSEVGKGCIMGNADPRLKQACPQLEQIGLNRHEAVASYLRATFGLY